MGPCPGRSIARVPVISLCVRVPVDCSCARVPVFPCARGFLVCPCSRGSAACPCAPVPVCPEGREETYLESLVVVNQGGQSEATDGLKGD